MKNYLKSFIFIAHYYNKYKSKNIYLIKLKEKNHINR